MSENEEETQQAPEEEKGVRIFLRIKPTKKSSGFFKWQEDERRMDYDIPRDVASGLVNNSRTKYVIAAFVP